MRSPAKLFLYVIYALIVVGLLTAIITSFHTKQASAPMPKSPSTGQQATKTPTPPAQPTQPTTQAQSPTSSPTATQPQPTTSQGQPGQLGNTGPGDTIGLFVAATAVGAVAYRVVLTRHRLNS